MKVLCKYNEVNNSLIEKLELNENVQKFKYTLTRGKEYIVLGLGYLPYLERESNYPSIDIKDDSGYLSSHPLFLFTILDARPSKYWNIQFNKNSGWLTMWPKSFYQKFYHDDLGNDIPEVLKDFEEVSKLLENEFLV